MRIVIDLQGAQSVASRNRGIGRYSLSLTEAIIRNRGSHEILVALNGAFPESIDILRSKLSNILPQENIVTWGSPLSTSQIEPQNHTRRKAAELIREAFLANFQPDIVLITSIFEGLIDDSVTSIGIFDHSIRTAVILYDLIPFIYRNPYLENAAYAAWYDRKIDSIRRADLLLAISKSSRDEGIQHLGFEQESCVAISTAVEKNFVPIQFSEDVENSVRQRLNLNKPFIMYTGGIDHRKNIEGLIRAFALLPEKLRQQHQLAIVCSIQTTDRLRLEEICKASSLAANSVIFTGYVSDDDLLALYNLCKLFVFPSWHEGFGLPALEAMACGKAVIGSNTSSIPEVIGREDALFNPYDERSISDRIQTVLEDDQFRSELEAHGLTKSQQFSWDHTAQLAILALESKVKVNKPTPSRQKTRPRLAYLSPLPPERSGISDYSVELLPELSRHYVIDIISTHSSAADPWIVANCEMRSIQWFLQHHREFDRILYHFGNSPYHSHMFPLLEAIPGVVVLHDFFLGHVTSYLDSSGIAPNKWSNELYISHGYNSVIEKSISEDPDKIAWRYPSNLSVIQSALGVIVHSNESKRMAETWYGQASTLNWTVVPLLRAAPSVKSSGGKSFKQSIGLMEDDFLVCSFGMIGRNKLNDRLLDAWLTSDLANDPRCVLVFVGENEGGDYGASISQRIREANVRSRILITGWIDANDYREYLAAADLGVQLRTLSRGETSAAVLDCMNFGIATIANDHGSFRDLRTGVHKLPDDFSNSDLAAALELFKKNPEARKKLGTEAAKIIALDHSPRRCSDKYMTIIEDTYEKSPQTVRKLAQAVANLGIGNKLDELEISKSIARNLPQYAAQPQLFVDISILVDVDSKTGIQRVVRSILREWILKPPQGFRVEPVFATESSNYKYARKFVAKFMGFSPLSIADDEIDFKQGDVFLCLDLTHTISVRHRSFYQTMRNHGVKVKFVVYDLLPTLMPHVFVDIAESLHNCWLDVVTESDGAVCISKAVADELYCWMEGHVLKHKHPFEISWAHLGADVDASMPSMGMPDNATAVLKKIRARKSFLVVGTIEPRKGHAQVLAAFESMWRKQIDINLVIVGRAGWKVDEFIARLRTHPELNSRLIWLDGISDEYLQKIYLESSCLIAASEGEGFGLPLIEAAQNGIPVIARDIAVFREVAGDNAWYFKGIEPESLATSVAAWLDNAERRIDIPHTKHMEWLTWEKSARLMFEAVVTKSPYQRRLPNAIVRFKGSDRRLQTQIGVRKSGTIQSTGRAGYLVYGPYIPVPCGEYNVSIKGNLLQGRPEGVAFDMVARGGEICITSMKLGGYGERDRLFDTNISINEPLRDVEIRVWLNESTRLEISEIQLTPLPRSLDTDKQVAESIAKSKDVAALTN